MGNSPAICEKHYAFLSPESLMASVEFRKVKKSPADSLASLSEAVEFDKGSERDDAALKNSCNVEKPRPQLRLVVNNR